MLHKLFSIYDSKSETYTPPLLEKTTASGIRVFIDAVQDEKTPWHTHAGDYTFFEIGTWDDNAGFALMYEAKKNLGNALEYLEQTMEMHNGPRLDPTGAALRVAEKGN